MNRIKKGQRPKKLTVILVVVLIITSIPPREVEAFTWNPFSWKWGKAISDLSGGMFTIITFPILLIAPHNPTLRKNNPFRPKEWEEEPVNEYNHPTIVPKNKTCDEIRDELKEKIDEHFERMRQQFANTLKSLLAEHINDEKLSEIVSTFMTGNANKFKGDTGTDGKDGKSFTLEDFKKAYETTPEFKQWVDANLKGENGQTPEIDYDALVEKIKEALKNNIDFKELVKIIIQEIMRPPPKQTPSPGWNKNGV